MDPKLLGFITQLQQAAGAAGNHVLNAAVNVTYWQSVVLLIMGGVLTLIGILLFVFAYRRTKAWFTAHKDQYDVPYHVVVDFVIGVVGIGSLIGGLLNILNPMNWMGAFAPRAALFYQIYDKLINK